MEIAIALGAIVLVCGGVVAVVFRRMQARNKTS